MKKEAWLKLFYKLRKHQGRVQIALLSAAPDIYTERAAQKVCLKKNAYSIILRDLEMMIKMAYQEAGMKGKILAVLLIALCFQGCASYRSWRYLRGVDAGISQKTPPYCVGYLVGLNLKKSQNDVEKSLDKLKKGLEVLTRSPARIRAIEIKTQENLDKSFSEIADETECKTDENFIADPNTPEDVRTILAKNLEKCRTRRQERALNRITCGKDSCPKETK